MPDLYPTRPPYDSGLLDVGQGHRIYWEVHGNPDGKAALVVHGGPGSGLSPWTAQLFDPERYRVVLYDQRNCGQSTPHASVPGVDLSANTTGHLIADIERLREHLEIAQWLLLGGSWGSTLALAYAETFPERVAGLVLFAVVVGLRKELDRVFGGGLATEFPEPWRRLREATVGPAGRDEDVVEAAHGLLFDSDPAVCARTAYKWCLWETAILEKPASSGSAPAALHPRARDPAYALAFTRIATHYILHDAWLEDGALLEGADALASIPAALINGRDDPQAGQLAKELAGRLPLGHCVFIEGAGHSARHPDFASEIIRATDGFAS